MVSILKNDFVLQSLNTYFISHKYSTQQDVVNEISSEININWYKANRDRLLN